MYTITWKILIKFSEISHLKCDLRAEESIKSTIGRPKRHSKDSNEIVRIIVKADVTGPAQEEVVQKTIIRYAESIQSKDDFGKSSLEKISCFLKRIGFISISSYAAILGAVFVYDPQIFHNHFIAAIALILASIPVSIGIGASSEIKF